MAAKLAAPSLKSSSINAQMYDTIADPASPVKAAPASPALSSEQIRNRSTKGWSGANAAATAGVSGLGIPPLNFRGSSSKILASSPMTTGSSSESSTIDGGSPFGTIISQFAATPALATAPRSPVDSTRKSSGSFQILNKKAVSNSPFLTGGNTTSSSPTTARKPFSPANVAQQFHQAQASWNSTVGNASTSASPVIPSSPARHGLGFLTGRTSQNNSPIHALSGRPSHKRNHSDAENVNPQGVINFHAKKVNAGTQDAAEVLASPRTLFNAEMAAIGAPPAMDVTHAQSPSSTPSSLNAEQTFPPLATQSPVRKARSSVAHLGNRASVSSSPFLQKQAAARESPVHARNSRMEATSIDVFTANSSATPVAIGDDMPSSTTLVRKKSVHWNEVEEVCEFYPETEDGESRRSSAASSVQSNGTDDSYGGEPSPSLDVDDDRNISEAIARAAREQGLAHDADNDDFYDNYRHSSLEPADDHVDDATLHTPLGTGHLIREASILSQHASVIVDEDMDESIAIGMDGDETSQDEMQELMRQVAAAQLAQHNVLPMTSPARQIPSELGGIRTPGSSTGPNASMMSEQLTPQPLNIGGSLSRRGPLPSPPGAPLLGGNDPASPTDYSFPQASMSESMRSPGADTSAFSLPDIGFSNSPFLNFDELGLSRKESMKRAAAAVPFTLAGRSHSEQGPSRPRSAVPVRQTKSSTGSNESDMETVDLSITAVPSSALRPRLTAQEVANSIRGKRPASALVVPTDRFIDPFSQGPLASTPPRKQERSGLSNLMIDVSTASPSRSKAISARPALSPTKISSEQLPLSARSMPSPIRSAAPSSEPESALDRLMRETSHIQTGLQPAVPLTPSSDGRSRASSSTSTASGETAETMQSSALSAESAREKPLTAREEIMRDARRRKGISMPETVRPQPRRRSLSTNDAMETLNNDMDHVESHERHLRTPSPPPKDIFWSGTPQDSPAVNFAVNNTAEPDFRSSVSRALDDVAQNAGRKYRVKNREHGPIAYARKDAKVVTVGVAGDVDIGNAPNKVRRASDMHKHKSEIRECKQLTASRARETGAVFVKIGQLFLSNGLPMPAEATYMTCEIRNALTHVATPAFRLSHKTQIAQEFELIAHHNLEVTVSFIVRKDPTLDPHLAPPRVSFVNSVPTSPPKYSPSTSSSSSGFKKGLRNLKNRMRPPTPVEMPVAQRIPRPPSPHPLLEYLKEDGELCRIVIRVNKLMKDCHGQQLKTMHKCYSSSEKAKQSLPDIGEVEIKLFYLPPLATVPIGDLPQSIDECLSGLDKAARAAANDRLVCEGYLAQLGPEDCKNWRRRRMQLKNSRLIAYNEVMHTATAFQIYQIVRLEDPEEGLASPALSADAPSASPASFTTARTATPDVQQHHRRAMSIDDGEEAFFGRPFSFRLVFVDKSEVEFAADTAEEKARWLRHLMPLVRGALGSTKTRSSVVPPHWAQVLHQMNKERTKEERAKEERAGPPIEKHNSMNEESASRAASAIPPRPTRPAPPLK